MADPEIVVVGALLAGATGAGIQSLRLPAGPGRAQWAFIGSALLGVLFCFVGGWNLIGIHTARHISISGTLAGLEQHGGRSSSSDFMVIPVTGQPMKVHCEYAGPHLRNGDNVVVDELSFHNTLLHLEVMDGRDLGWKLTEGDGSVSSATVLVLGAALIFGARAHRLKNPEG